MGGIRFANLSTLAKAIWSWCEPRDFWIIASFISSKDTAEADLESRKLEARTEFELADEAFEQIVERLGHPKIEKTQVLLFLHVLST